MLLLRQNSRFPFPWAMLKDLKKLLSVLVPMPTYRGRSDMAGFKAGIICISSQEVGMVTSDCSTLPLKSQVSGGHYSTQRCCCIFYYCGYGAAAILQLVFLSISILKTKLGFSPKEFPLLVAVSRCLLQKVQQINQQINPQNPAN